MMADTNTDTDTLFWVSSIPDAIMVDTNTDTDTLFWVSSIPDIIMVDTDTRYFFYLLVTNLFTVYCITVPEKFIHPWTHGVQYNDMLFNTCMRLKQPFYINQHSDIKSKVVCSVWSSLQLIIIIHEDVKYRKSIEIVSKSTRYRYQTFWRYRYFEMDSIHDTCNCVFNFFAIAWVVPPNNLVTIILCAVSIYYRSIVLPALDC